MSKRNRFDPGRLSAERAMEIGGYINREARRLVGKRDKTDEAETALRALALWEPGSIARIAAAFADMKAAREEYLGKGEIR